MLPDIVPEPLTSLQRSQTVPATPPPSAPPSVTARLTRPTVSAMMNKWGPWTCCMALIGICEDGIPVSARWKQPKRASHYLYAGGDEMTLVTLVEPMLYSIAYQGKIPPKYAGAPDASKYAYGHDRIRYAIVSQSSTWWDKRVAEAEHCAGIVPPDSTDGQKLLQALQISMNTRLAGRAKTPNVQTIVVLHDLGAYWNQWDDSAHDAWRAILARGHRVGIHLVVTMQYTHLLNWTNRLPSQKLYGVPGDHPLPNAPIVRDLAAMGMMSLPAYVGMTHCGSGGQWMKFIIPSVG